MWQSVFIYLTHLIPDCEPSSSFFLLPSSNLRSCDLFVIRECERYQAFSGPVSVNEGLSFVAGLFALLLELCRSSALYNWVVLSSPSSVDRLVLARMMGTTKPNRSEDLSITAAEQEQHALQVRAYLDANAPHRELKPARSDAADADAEISASSNAVTDPPEHKKYLSLLASGVPLETRGSHDVSDEFTESDYYKAMATIDKAHHTTGTGFIKVDSVPAEAAFHLADSDARVLHHCTHHRCNPAMNDWEPAANGSFSASSKPSRSEAT